MDPTCRVILRAAGLVSGIDVLQNFEQATQGRLKILIIADCPRRIISPCQKIE